MSEQSCTKLLTLLVAFFLTAPMFGGIAHAQSGAKADLYTIYMMPYGRDARDYNRPGFGIGGNVTLPIPSTSDALAGVVGLEYINLLSENLDGQDYIGGVAFPYSQQTTQGFARFYLGPQFGAHNTKAVIQPHAGADIGLAVYWISTDIVVNDNAGNEIRKNKSSNTHAVFGFDLNMGVDMQFWDNVSIDAGVKYLKSFSVPQQLGEGSLTMYPQYFQVTLGVGVSFDFIKDRVKEP
jgi:opacity protein-like surface antigen